MIAPGTKVRITDAGSMWDGKVGTVETVEGQSPRIIYSVRLMPYALLAFFESELTPLDEPKEAA